MGAFGWTLLADARTVSGSLASWSIEDNDGDVCLKIIPRPEDRYLLTNPRGNVTNQNGQIECEVRPPNASFDSAAGAVFFDPIVGRSDVQVTVNGVWVADNSHNYLGETTNLGDTQSWLERGALDVLSGGLNEATRLTPVPDPDHGKTELHPATSILIEYPPEPGGKAGTSLRVDYLVLSDDPTTWLGPYRPFAPPHSGESVAANFTIPFPATNPGVANVDLHRFEVRGLDDHAQKSSLSVTGDFMVAAVETGPHGYYYLGLELFTESARPGQPNFVQGTWGGIGNYELLVPQGERVVHYARLNDPGADQFRWIYIREVSFAGHDLGGQRFQLGATPVSVSLLQSTFRGDGTHGNLDAVVRVTPAGLDQSGDTLDFIALDSATSTWSSPQPILVNGAPISGVTGD